MILNIFFTLHRNFDNQRKWFPWFKEKKNKFSATDFHLQSFVTVSRFSFFLSHFTLLHSTTLTLNFIRLLRSRYENLFLRWVSRISCEWDLIRGGNLKLMPCNVASRAALLKKFTTSSLRVKRKKTRGWRQKEAQMINQSCARRNHNEFDVFVNYE